MLPFLSHLLNFSQEHTIKTKNHSWGRLLPDDLAGAYADQVLRYWFGEEQDPKEQTYKHPSALWFRGGPAVDAEIKERFGEGVIAADTGALDALRPTAHGCLALVLLLDQFPRHIHRGDAAMFRYDAKAQEIALYAIQQGFDLAVAPAERLFFYFALEHAEDIERVRQAVALKARLIDDSPLPQRQRFERMHQSALQHLEILTTFGRYPHRNALLGRQTTPEEAEFLQTKRYGFMRSVQPHTTTSPVSVHFDAAQNDATALSDATHPDAAQPDDTALSDASQPDTTALSDAVKADTTALSDVAQTDATALSTNNPFDAAFSAIASARSNRAIGLQAQATGTPATMPKKLNILVLHSFRQNARVMRARTRKLRQALEEDTTLIFANAPLPYDPTGEVRDAVLAAFGRLQDTEHQRCWWNADESNTTYEGIELSFAYIKQMDDLYGPFDGIVGFSQGGALAGLLAAMREELGLSLRFVVCISGFPSRADAHRSLLQPGKIALPSLHIVGANDILVDPTRTHALATCFQDAVVIEHRGGHFVPDRWPVQEIRAFVQKFRTAPQEEAETPTTRAAQRLQQWTWLTSSAQNNQAVALLPVLTDAFAALSSAALRSEDILSLVGQLQQADKAASAARFWVALWLYNAETETPHRTAIEEAFAQIPRVLGWSWLCRLAEENAQNRDATNTAVDRRLQELHRWIVMQFSTQLAADRALLEQGLAVDSSDPHTLEGLAWPSDCAWFAPKRRNAVDKSCRLACDIAMALWPLPEQDAMVKPWTEEGLQKAKAYRYTCYHRMLRDLRKALDHVSLDFADRQRNQRIQQIYEQSRQRVLLGQDPIPAPILHPAPEPVLPCAPEELEPLLDWLREDSPVREVLAFTRGTLLPDGRLDLCKQVVGPEGIGPLLGAMQHSSHVTRLLLGNNIVGDEGARQIAAYIRSGRSKLEGWYIAGNEITPDGLRAVTEAIGEDPKVRHLWLKRNPLGAEGMVHIAALLKTHPALEVLDLLNCGLLDRGIEALEEGWIASRTLRHLYLDANGLTARSALVIARCLAEGPPLHSLFLSCNRLGDEGIRLLAPALAANTSLQRLSFASNRLTAQAAAILAEALCAHPTLLHLDLGYMRGTGALGESGNFLGDEGAEHLAGLLRQNRVLRSVDLLHNDIGQAGLSAICAALRDNHQVIRLQFTQFSKAHNEYTREEIKTLLARNEAAVLDWPSLQETILLPRHLQEIHSVYRTRV